VLGHKVSTKRLEVEKTKIHLISNLLVRTSVKQIRSFLDPARFYRRFIKDFSKVAHPLINLLCKDTLLCLMSLV